jgi:ethanolamine utilization protein EutN
MQLGLVVGTGTSTTKHASLRGWKLLIVQPLMADGQAPDGDPRVAIDNLGAGAGDRVIISSDGEGSRALLGVEASPVQWCVVGLPDDKTS